MDAVYSEYAGNKATSVINFSMLLEDFKNVLNVVNSKSEGTVDKDDTFESQCSDVSFEAFDVGDDQEEIVDQDRQLILSCLQAVHHKNNVVRYKPQETYNMIPENKTDIEDLVPGEELLFVIGLYAPVKSGVDSSDKRPVKKDHTIIVLGSQFLNELCDKIMCIETHQEVFHELSNDPMATTGVTMGEAFKSRMLYIGNTFYIDKSFEGYIDYSKTVKEWGKDHKLEFGETLSMHDTMFRDLTARVNFPYLFQHYGNCEHLVVIEDVRLLTKEDCLQKSLYPFYHHIAESFRTKKCMICTQDTSMWIVFNEPRLPLNPSWLCSGCFLSFQYVDGKKVSNFTAIRHWGIPHAYTHGRNECRKAKFELDEDEDKDGEDL